MLGVVAGGGIVQAVIAPITRPVSRNAEFETKFRPHSVLSTTTSADPLTTMSADQDESARLWKVNRTIHELVKDRVCRVERQ